MVVDLERLKAENLARWNAANILPKWVHKLDQVAHRLVDSKQRYVTVQNATKVPWPFIAVTHQRESGQDWTRSLAQGDRFDRVSTHVPRGRGPFKSWEAAAIDALVECPPHASHNTDWSIGGTLTLLESYNGLGYFKRGLPSPYIWSFTDQYKSGKYIRDGVFDPNKVDEQTGCAGLLARMILIDPTIQTEWHP